MITLLFHWSGSHITSRGYRYLFWSGQCRYRRQLALGVARGFAEPGDRAPQPHKSPLRR